MFIVFALVLSLISPSQDVFAEYTISGASGEQIPVRYYSPPFSGAPIILVVHDWGESMENWQSMAANFRELGFGVLCFALPGHEVDDISKYYHDNNRIAGYLRTLSSVYNYARGRGSEVHLLGAGLGANLAMLFAAQTEVTGRVVAVSPGLNYRGLEIHPEVCSAIAGKLMLIASQEDTYSAYSIRTFRYAFAQLPEEERPPAILYSNAGHGVWLLKRLPEAVVSVTRWLSDN